MPESDLAARLLNLNEKLLIWPRPEGNNFIGGYEQIRPFLRPEAEPALGLLPDSVPRPNEPNDAAKIVLAIHDFHPDISYATVLNRSGGGATVFWQAPAHKQRTKAFSSLAEIGDLGYFSLLRHCALLMPVEEGVLFQLIGQSLAPSLLLPSSGLSWEELFAVWSAGGNKPGLDQRELKEQIQAELLDLMEGYKRELEDIKARLGALEKPS